MPAAATAEKTPRAEKTYRTSIPKPDATFYGTTERELLREMVEKCAEVCFPRVQGDVVVLEFQSADDYDLAITVRDLEDGLNSTPFHEHSVQIPRPTPVRARRAPAKRPVAAGI